MRSVALTVNTLWFIMSTNYARLYGVIKGNHGLVLTELQLPEENGIKPRHLKSLKAAPKQLQLLPPDDRNSVWAEYGEKRI